MASIAAQIKEAKRERERNLIIRKSNNFTNKGGPITFLRANCMLCYVGLQAFML